MYVSWLSLTATNDPSQIQALWKSWEGHTDPITHDFIRSRQRIHVSIISVCSFSGRLLGGIGSDLIVQKLKGSRFWCIFASAALFTMAQCVGIVISNPRLLVVLSTTTGSKLILMFC